MDLPLVNFYVSFYLVQNGDNGLVLVEGPWPFLMKVTTFFLPTVKIKHTFCVGGSGSGFPCYVSY